MALPSRSSLAHDVPWAERHRTNLGFPEAARITLGAPVLCTAHVKDGTFHPAGAIAFWSAPIRPQSGPTATLVN
jgi:hypothetical protein